MITSSNVYGVQQPQTSTLSSPDSSDMKVDGIASRFQSEMTRVQNTTPEFRVINEKRELEDKILKLAEFILSDKFNSLSEDHRFLLAKQQNVMQEYSDVLTDRIRLFTNEKNNI